jgi:anaerobic selenocysteine-containing dehydrogenase
MPETTHYRTCNLCEAMCGLELKVEDGRVTSVRGDAADVFSKGHICPKGPAIAEVWADPDRLRKPMRRTANGFVEVSWEDALSEAAQKLRAVRERHGKNSLATYVGNPVVHNHGALVMLQGFLRAVGSKNRFDANSLDTNPKLLSALQMFGGAFSVLVPDVDNTDYMLMIGANPAASNGSLMSLGDVRGRLTGIRKRGGKLVLVDPRRTETAAWASEHHFITPGTDAAFLLALLHVLFAEGLAKGPPQPVNGLDALKALAARFAPERVAARVGITAATIRDIARGFAAAPRAVAYGRVGTCVTAFGALSSWLIDAVNVVTGNFDRPGGALFPSPAVDVAGVASRVGGSSYARWRSRVRGLPELAGTLPAAVMAEEMETPGEGQIRGLITFAGNPVLSSPNGERLRRALEGLEFMVSIDCYVNETTRHANLILPPIHSLEHGHYDLLFHMFAVRNTVKYSPPVFPTPPGGKDDWEILYELGMRLGGMRFGFGPGDRALKALWRLGVKVTPDRIIDLGLRAGPYKGLSLKAVRKQPHGIDLGPLVPTGTKNVRTRDRRVNVAPQVMLDDVPRLERWLDAPAPGLVLIGRRHLRTNNSWMHNCRSLVKGPNRATLMMHASDAARLELSAGQTVKVRSRTGEVSAALEVSDAIAPGVVSLPHGYGHGSIAAFQRVAGATAGPNINTLTDDAEVEPLTGTAVLNGVPVSVEAAR